MAWAGPLVFVPLVPAVAYAWWFGPGVVRIVRLRRLPRFGGALLVFCLVGALVHVAATANPPAPLSSTAMPPAGIEVSPSDGTNLLGPGFGRTLQGHAYGRYVVAWGSRRDRGFWQVPRYEPATDAEVDRIRGGDSVLLRAGVPYTISFYVRDPVPEGAFAVVFRTPSQPIAVEPQVEAVGDGLWRVHATWEPPAPTELVHAFEVSRFAGTWRFLTIGWVQLEEGPAPSTYHRPHADSPTAFVARVRGGLVWWLGTGLLGVVTLAGMGATLERVSGRTAAVALVVGLALQLAASLVLGSGVRAAGLAAHPNLLGHGSVMGGLVAAMLGPPLVGAAGLAVAGGLVASSGSRSAFLVWVVVVLGAAAFWWFGRRRSRSRRRAWWVGGLVALSIATVLAVSPRLGGGTFESIVASEDANVARRLAIWGVALDAVRQHPWAGVGQGRFGDWLALTRPLGSEAPRALHAHNALLHLAAESGIPGAAAFLVLLGWLAVAAWRHRRFAVIGFLAALLALNAVDYTVFSGLVFLPLLLAMRLVRSPPERNGIRGTPRTPSEA